MRAPVILYNLTVDCFGTRQPFGLRTMIMGQNGRSGDFASAYFLIVATRYGGEGEASR